MESGFSCPSTAPGESAGCASAQLIWVGLAPSAVKVSLNSGEPTTRIFSPFRSSGLRTSRFEFVSSRKPFSPQASGTTSLPAMISKSFFPASLVVMASIDLWSGIRNGSEKRFSSTTCGDQLIVEPTAMSITPWRMAVNSLVWSPPTSDAPG